MKKWLRVPMLTALATSFAACTGQVDAPDAPVAAAPQAELQSTTPGLDDAFTRTTSTALAEVVAVYDRSLAGTEYVDLAGASFAHQLVVDFAGHPFQDIVFTSGITAAAGPGCDDGTATVAVGASRAVMPVNWSHCGSDLRDRITALVKTLGADNVDAIVAAEASTYLVRTTGGDYWDVGNGEKLTPDQVAELRARYDSACADIEASALDVLDASWQPFDGALQGLDTYTRPDGGLDLPAVLALASGPSLRDQMENGSAGSSFGAPGASNIYSTWTGSCYYFLWWLLGCDGYESGHLANPTRKQAHYPYQFGGYTVGGCAGGTYVTDAGCGPAAFASMVDWLWRVGTPVSGAGFAHGNEPYTPWFADTVRHNQLNLYKRVEHDTIGSMSACSWGSSGTMTLPANFLSGGNSWLGANVPGVSLNGNVGTFIANWFMGNTWASRLRSQIGNDVGPAVGGFHIDSLGAFDYHYSPIDTYYVERPYWNMTRVSITSLDGYSSNLTNPWSFFSGVYWLSGNIGGCRFGDDTMAWSCNGPIGGYAKCIHIDEPSDPHTWGDNYLCYNPDNKRLSSMSWSHAGPIGGLPCTQTLESADPDTWADNFVCTNPGGPGMAWTSAWTTDEHCYRWSEPSDPHTWDDNFHCHY